MNPKNTLCIAEWQSFGIEEIKQTLKNKHKTNAAPNDSNTESSETKTAITDKTQLSTKVIESKAQKIFNELVEFAKYESNHHFLKLIRQNGTDRLKAQNYVGLIQTKSGFCVEILPKTFRTTKESEGFKIYKKQENKVIDKAKKLLLNMLKTLKNSPFKHTQFANLKAWRFSLLEIFVLMFIDELEKLVKKGIRANYLSKEQNRTFLKGKLLFNENIKYNLTHKERFYTASDEFSHNIPENALIKSTLAFLKTLSLSSKTQSKLMQMHFIFADIKPSKNIDKDLSKCANTRHFKAYENILLWCKVFLKKQSFTAYQGASKAFALLFDMNILFESYVASEMKKWLDNGKNTHCRDFMQVIFEDSKPSIKTQHKAKYLAFTHKDSVQKDMFNLKPDIVGYKKDKSSQATFIADTKWKILKHDSANDNIAQADIYQIWAYLCKYQCQKGFLIYPANTDGAKDNTKTDTKPILATLTFKPNIVFANILSNASTQDSNKDSKQILQDKQDLQSQSKITLHICLFPLN